MPKNLFQRIIFTLMMVLVMVYAMICYNIAISKGGMSNQVFLIAFQELIIMAPIAFVLEFFFVEKLTLGLAFRLVDPRKDRPALIVLTISTVTVCIMCPIMSFFAALIFGHPGNQIIAVWLETTVRNFPMALFWQIIYGGNLVRFLFKLMFPEKKETAKA